jgi:alanine dehydrogenase
LQDNPHLRNGLNIRAGEIAYEAVAESLAVK